MGDPTFADAPDPRYIGIYPGEVMDNNDPLGIGRCRLCVPGLLPDEGGGWFLPFAGSGVGAQEGLWHIPTVGSSAYVFFLGGDPDKGRYTAGNWRKPVSGRNVPEPVETAIQEDGTAASVQLKVWQSKSFSIVHDDRGGKERFFIKSNARGEDIDGSSSLILELDDSNGVMSIVAPVGIVLRSLGFVDIQGTQINIGGRPVLQGIPKPI